MKEIRCVQRRKVFEGTGGGALLMKPKGAGPEDPWTFVGMVHGPIEGYTEKTRVLGEFEETRGVPYLLAPGERLEDHGVRFEPHREVGAMITEYEERKQIQED